MIYSEVRKKLHYRISNSKAFFYYFDRIRTDDANLSKKIALSTTTVKWGANVLTRGSVTGLGRPSYRLPCEVDLYLRLMIYDLIFFELR